MDKSIVYTNYIGLSDFSTWTTMAWVHFVQASWARLHPNLLLRFGCWSNIMGNKGYQRRRHIRWEETSGQFSDAGRLSSREFHVGATAKCSRMWTVVRISRQIPEIWPFMRTGCRSSFCIGSRRNSSGAQRMVPDLTGVHLPRRTKSCNSWNDSARLEGKPSSTFMEFALTYSQGFHGGVYLQVMQSLFDLFSSSR